MLLLALLSGCVSAPPDFLACANLGKEGYCRTYVTHKQLNIDSGKNPYKSSSGKVLKWDEVVASSVLIPADQFVFLKNFFDNYCHQNTCPNGLGDWNSFANDLSVHLK